MILTVEITGEAEARLRARALRTGQNAEALAAAVLAAAVLAREEEPPGPARSASPPAWLADLEPRNPAGDGTNGLHRIFGKWPGDETEEDLLVQEQRLDDEDAGRVRPPQ